MKPLDTLTFPLSGTSLIEASAGTGKTYTIVNLYLRLLLGHGCAPLDVEQILVVTFTNAATGELKQRIRQRLRQAYLGFLAGSSTDPIIQCLIEQSQQPTVDCQRLALASQQMDQAAVYTIHGFCHKALTEHAFESGALYEQRFILDQSQWLQLAVEDYWRKYVVTQNSGVSQLLLKEWASPKILLSKIQPLLSQHALPLQSQDKASALQSVQDYQTLVTKMKHWWLSNKISEQLFNAGLKGNVKLAKLGFLAAMEAFCHGDLIQMDFDAIGWPCLYPEQLLKAAKKGSLDLTHLDFSRFELLEEQLVACQRQIKLCFSAESLKVVAANLQSHKARLQLLSPDDLLVGLQTALKNNQASNNNALAAAISEAYPAVLIDEFQDTDPTQFEVFKGIYAGTALDAGALADDQKSQLCWVMIGDPKQAIYAFRGADIFTYIRAKQWVDPSRHFTLTTNWRSAPKLVQSINRLFENSQDGFLFEDNIPFNPVLAGKALKGLYIKSQELPSLAFQHLCSEDNTPISAGQASKSLAIHTANQIAYWLQLAQDDQALIGGENLTAGDCCVLVRNRSEAQLVKTALWDVQVASVFLARKSVFDSQVARDLLRLLKALGQGTDERLLKTALMSEIFSLNAQGLESLFSNESKWQSLLEQRFYWHQSWQQFGVMRAINQVLDHFQVEQSLIKLHHDGLRRITDLRHLVELLQQQSMQLVGENQLIHWFESCLLAPDHNSESQQVRLESDADLVQIITLHSSKGLEFPLVFVPFASTFKNSKEALYHNEQQQLEVDFLQQSSNLDKANFERLAEDIRLFYVAVTRAIYYCSIGIWNIVGTSKKVSGFSGSALGSLLLSADIVSPETLKDSQIAQLLETLVSHSDASYSGFTQPQNHIQLAKGALVAPANPLQSQQLKQPVTRVWRLTSYSAISSQQAHLDVPTPGLDEGKDQDSARGLTPSPSLLIQTEQQSAFSFERGANAGSFLHGVLENIDFQQPQQLVPVIQQQGSWFGIDPIWYSTLESWLTDLLTAAFSLEQPELRLCHLSPQQVKVEMEFHMPLHQVALKPFNEIINHYFKQHSRDYQFQKLNGMIKGFIDLMFEFNGKYYVADYKSNHLGDDLEAYHYGNMFQSMTEHDYHLQAILYTLALHRWLKYKLPDYNYQQHIGGAYYLFIRGMSSQKPGNGVYFFCPQQSLIENLDALFAGHELAIRPQEQLTNATSGPTTGQLDLW